MIVLGNLDCDSFTVYCVAAVFNQISFLRRAAIAMNLILLSLRKMGGASLFALQVLVCTFLSLYVSRLLILVGKDCRRRSCSSVSSPIFSFFLLSFLCNVVDIICSKQTQFRVSHRGHRSICYRER